MPSFYVYVNSKELSPLTMAKDRTSGKVRSRASKSPSGSPKPKKVKPTQSLTPKPPNPYVFQTGDLVLALYTDTIAYAATVINVNNSDRTLRVRFALGGETKRFSWDRGLVSLMFLTKGTPINVADVTDLSCIAFLRRNVCLTEDYVPGELLEVQVNRRTEGYDWTLVCMEKYICFEKKVKSETRYDPPRKGIVRYGTI
uniref:Tudor domain-containing protein n=1 Tax=Panagrellus redivivus TaxID=6233 RepID=A0A7E4V140_PANRE